MSVATRDDFPRWQKIIKLGNSLRMVRAWARDGCAELEGWERERERAEGGQGGDSATYKINTVDMTEPLGTPRLTTVLSNRCECSISVDKGKMRINKRNHYRQPDSPDSNRKSKKDSISKFQLT
ncbi:hypothetical protein J6590_004355 [Homalodisca vitripennis]|nr:hypothetical protein J6590_004355 [Homalodisca vitripennis]